MTLIHGEAIAELRKMADNSVDSIVTDPPYELSFMGKKWDGSGIAFSVELWAECLRVLKPGGHLLSFGGTRTWHRMACAIEDAGFELRDSIAWLYGSGFPKSLDVSKAIDKAAGAEREVIGERKKLQSYGSTDGRDVNAVYGSGPDKGGVQQITAPATDAARQWQGWGTALKPAFEPIVVARKPPGGTVAKNVQEWGTGALNVGATRVGNEKLPAQRAGQARLGTFERSDMVTPERDGRWPTNVVLDDTAAMWVDEDSGITPSNARANKGTGMGYKGGRGERGAWNGGDSGGASRFFPVFKYQAKAPKKERPKVDGVSHPTVKPLELMRWLVRLVTPPGGVVLDPFLGSGTTAEAAELEGFEWVGVEMTAEYLPLIEQRLAKGGA